MKKSLLWIVLLILSISIVAAFSEIAAAEKAVDPAPEKVTFSTTKSDGFIVGYSNGYIGNTWRAQYVEDIQTRADLYKQAGIISRFDLANSPADVTQQLVQINAMISCGDYDAIIIDAVSATSVGPAVEKAKARGMLVVIANDLAPYPGTYNFAGNSFAIWTIEPEWIAEKLNGKGNIVMISGLPGITGDTIRLNCAYEVLKKYPDIKILAKVPGNWSPAIAQQEMTTLLATYGDDIDAVLTQDVMGIGIIQAFENSGKELVPMTGDFTYAFLKKWKELNIDSIIPTYDPGYGSDVLGLTIRVLQGKQFKDGALQPNPLDESLINTIYLDPAYVITNEAQPDASWLEGLEYTKSISLDEALALMEGKEDNAAVDRILTEQQLDSYFK